MKNLLVPASISALDPELGHGIRDTETARATSGPGIRETAGLLEDLLAVRLGIPESGVAGRAGNVGEDGVVDGGEALAVVAA